MTFYSYVCAGGHPISSQKRADKIWCREHEQYARRRWVVNIGPSFEPHYNHSLGTFVASSRDFDEKLKVAGDEQHTTYARIDPGEAPRPIADDGIFDTQLRTLSDKGFTGEDGKVTVTDDGHYVPKR